MAAVIDSESRIASDGSARLLDLPLAAPIAVADIWGSDVAVCAPSDGRRPYYQRYFPGPGGYRVIVIEWQPAHAVTESGRADYLARRDEVMVGYSHDSVAGTAIGEHATSTVDIGVVLSGELTLIIGEQATVLRTGDWIVQNGASHSWQNRSSEPCRAAFFVLGAQNEAAINLETREEERVR